MAPAEKIPLPFRWQFVPVQHPGDGSIRWVWKAFAQTGELTMQSTQAFDTFTDCLEDAKAKGYDK